MKDRPVCNASDGAKEQFAVARVAEHDREKARRDENHPTWIDEHTENRTLSEIHGTLADRGRPRS